MDERLKQALEFSNYRQTLNNQLQNTKVRVQGSLIFAKAGGTFQIGQELICFLDYLIRTDIHTTVILDSYDTPIQIDNVSDFLKEITIRYFEVLNDYYKEYQSIRKSRNVKSILDLKED